METGRFACMNKLKELKHFATCLLSHRTLSIDTTFEAPAGAHSGGFLGSLFGALKKETRRWKLQGWDLPSLTVCTHMTAYEAIPGLKELTDKFFKESDELITKGIESFQAEFDALDQDLQK